MQKTLIMTKGLPASGKSTWARKMVNSNPYLKIVNKDSLRLMLDDGKWSRKNEKFIVKSRNALISAALADGYSVICDDTNFHQSHETVLYELALNNSAKFEIKEFDITLEEAIKRDLARPASVGEAVIKQMYRQYVCPIEELKQDVTLARAIICDLDGTLAHMQGRRSPYHWDKVGDDSLDSTVAEILDRYKDHVIILVSGRDEVCRTLTTEWLNRHNIKYNFLYMRPENDQRPDTIIKKEIFEEYILDHYNVVMVLDDRDSVVKMWREAGLKVLQVGEGAF